MKKLILLSLFIGVLSAIVSAQHEKVAAPSFSFTKTELLAFKNVQTLLSSINKDRDYSKYLIRNFNLTTTVKNADGTETKVSEIGPGGTWSEKQKNMIEKYAAKDVVFILENIVLVEQGKKGTTNQSDVSFSIKE